MSGFAFNDRNGKIARVAAQWWREMQRGCAVPREILAARHQELMPELLEHIRLMEGMREALLNNADADSLLDVQQTATFPTRQSPDLICKPQLDVTTHEAMPHERNAPGTARKSRLVAGTLLDNRYAICHLLGQGGMGTVYLAEDKLLDKLVAVKTFDRGFTAKFRDQIVHEALLAHRVTHINVCRIHDIELEHEPAFLTMEYIDGEDLDQTLLRIGRFVPERALQISLDICLGLSAAHEQGVIHRDIKPRNIMLDSTGMVRITDFGLARTSYSEEQVIAGTPAYMAPEQRQGLGTSKLSDIYSLGSVLHEIYTGKPPQPLNSTKRIAKYTSFIPPSHLLPDIDPRVERTILRCLETNPKYRPQSVQAVGDSLEGSDKLRYLVDSAAMPSREPLRWMAIASLVGLVLCWMLSRYRPIEYVTFLANSPQEYSERATELIKSLGYDVESAASDHRAQGFGRAGPFVNDLSKADDSILFWYRQASVPLTPTEFVLHRNQSTTSVQRHDPSWDQPSMIGVQLATNKSLIEFRSVPTAEQTSQSHTNLQSDLEKLFESAGLSYKDYTQHAFESQAGKLNVSKSFGVIKPQFEYVPKIGADDSRVLVSTENNHVTHFQVVRASLLASIDDDEKKLGAVLNDVLFVVVVIGAMSGFVLARRNSREQELDSHGAKVTAAIVFVSLILSLIFSASHTYDFHEELGLWERGVLNAVCWTALLWLLYMSLEPFVRREYPLALRDWLLLTHGELRRVSVAFRILGGAMLGFIAAPLLNAAHTALRESTGLPLRYSIPPIELPAIEDLSGLASAYFDSLANSIYSAFAIVLFPMLLNRVFRNFKLAVLIAWTVNSLFYGSYYGAAIEEWWDFSLFTVYMSIWAGIHLFVALRGGILAAAVHLWVSSIIFFTPFTLTDRWYRGEAIASTLVLATAIITYAIWVTHQSSQKLFSTRH